MSTANTHPGLTFGVGGLRRGFPPPQSKPPSLPQHGSPYPSQTFAPQSSGQNPYPQHLFPSHTPPTVPGISSISNVPRTPQSQLSSGIQPPRQRAPPPRQTQINPPLPYLPQSLNSQPLVTQSMSQNSLTQAIQPGDTSILTQQPASHPPPQPPLPPQTSAQSQVPQLPHALQLQKLPQVSQIPSQQTQIGRQSDGTAAAQEAGPHAVGEEMDVESPPSAEVNGVGLDPKLGDGRPFVPRQPMGEMMSAPPEGGSYPTLDAVHKAVLDYCTSVGYAVVIGRSKKTVPGLKKVLFVCDRAGKPPKRVSPEVRKRKTSSRKCDCQFGFFAIEQRTQWTIRYRPDPVHLRHNHGPSESPMLHPAARKLDSKMVAAVKNLKDSGEQLPVE
jgi:hypothetical protein